MSKYKIDRVIGGRFAIWYKEITNKKNLLGVYKILDLYSNSKEISFARRYKARPDQTQEILDNAFISKGINRLKTLKK